MPDYQIERFTSWGEIFPNTADAELQYAALVDGLRGDYASNNSLSEVRIDIDSNTGLSVTTFDRKPTGPTTVQRLANGDVRVGFSTGSVMEIVPPVGNRRHDWTYDIVTSLQRDLRSLERETSDSRLLARLGSVNFYLKGKMAAQDWEEEMLRMDFLPQRVGYRIYPEAILREAQGYLKN
jgi:hypothetical protein